MDVGNYKVKKDVLYRDVKWWEAESSKLDIYYQESLEKKPVVVFIHGGSWTSGDKSYFMKKPNILHYFLDQGFVVVSVNFRLVGEIGAFMVSYRHQAEDIAHAIKWLSKNVQEYGGFNNQIFLVGYSSGAHLASLVATDTSYLKKQDVSIESIMAVIALDVPAYDVPMALKLMKGSSLEENIPLNESIFGKELKDQVKGSPSFFVFGSRVPFLLVSTGIKNGRPQSVTKAVTESFKNALIKSGHLVSHVHYKNHSHSSFLLALGKSGDNLGKVMTSFIRQVLKDYHLISSSSELDKMRRDTIRR
ncbi:MAG: alpha/beta hydrolase [Gammaproteobacteria bacterium]|nr:alpha/beta hydrolase [Gammaproteobacteria bacterium]